MLQRLIHNTAISAIAYGVAGLLGLVSISIIINAYGITAFGLIVLARSFQPVNFLAIIDFGMSENATQAVARARGGGSWTTAGEYVSILLIGACLIGLLAAAILCLFCPSLTILFKVDPDFQAGFVRMIWVTALALPILFVGLVVEGVIKGFESYGCLRLLEIASTTGYVISVYVLTRLGLPFESVAYASVALIIIKYFLLALAAWWIAAASPLGLQSWHRENLRAVLKQSWIMFNNRLINSIQWQVQPLLIGATVGAGGVGIVEVLTRLPRFLKSVLALLSSALLPVSARIDAASDTERMLRLGHGALIFTGVLSLPILTSIGLFSYEILRIWLGPALAVHWPWLALGLLIPATNALIGPGLTVLLVRPDFVRRTTRVLWVQVILQYAVAFVAMGAFGERSFILGQALSLAFCAPTFVRMMLKEWRLSERQYWIAISKQAVILLVVGVLATAIRGLFAPLGFVGLTASLGVCCMIAWGLGNRFILSREDRAYFLSVLRPAGKFAR